MPPQTAVVRAVLEHVSFFNEQKKYIVIIDYKVNYDYIVFMSLAQRFETLIPNGLSIGSDTPPRRFMEDTAMGS